MPTFSPLSPHFQGAVLQLNAQNQLMRFSVYERPTELTSSVFTGANLPDTLTGKPENLLGPQDLCVLHGSDKPIWVRNVIPKQERVLLWHLKPIAALMDLIAAPSFNLELVKFYDELATKWIKSKHAGVARILNATMPQLQGVLTPLQPLRTLDPTFTDKQAGIISVTIRSRVPLPTVSYPINTAQPAVPLPTHERELLTQLAKMIKRLSLPGS
jgi:hypothetical protein